MTTEQPVSFEDLYAIFQQHPLISTDSRQVTEGSLFFALKGDQFDGNKYAFQALEKGAAYAIIDDPRLMHSPSPTPSNHQKTTKSDLSEKSESATSFKNRLLLVPDALEALQQLAAHHRRHLGIPLIAITGSNGKTTTKELIHAVLAKKYHTIATEGNFNNHIGVPLTLLRITPETEIAIVEMGANHEGEIAFLCSLAQPTHGLITNIGRAHLEGFGSFEGVIRAKTELYQYLLKHQGTIFLNTGDKTLVSHCHTEASIDYCLLGTSQSKEPNTAKESTRQPMISMAQPMGAITAVVHSESQPTQLQITFPDGGSPTLNSKLFGTYNAINILAAACVGNHFDVPEKEIIANLKACQPSNNRSQLFKSDRNLLVLDAYNANPTSMHTAIEAFIEAFPENRMMILGDMLELGDASEQEHRKILEKINPMNCANIFLVGPIFTKLNHDQKIVTFVDVEKAVDWFAVNPPSEKNILLKGSRGIQLEKIIPYL